MSSRWFTSSVAVLRRLALGSGLLAGCSEADLEPELDALPGEELVSVDVDAERGGTLELDEATVVIPPYAVAEPTTLTLAKRSAERADGAAIYELGPPGLELAVPADVSLTFDRDALPGGVTPTLAEVRDDDRVPIPSSVGDGVVFGDLRVLGGFALALVHDPRFASTCLDDSFDACGGDVRGVWRYASACAWVAALPGFESCLGASASLDLDVAGSLEFAGDGTYVLDGAQTLTSVFRIPHRCLEADSCEGLQTSDSAQVDGAACRWSDRGTQESSSAGTWATRGGVIAIDIATAQFCVRGDELTIRFAHPLWSVAYRLTRA